MIWLVLKRWFCEGQSWPIALLAQDRYFCWSKKDGFTKKFGNKNKNPGLNFNRIAFRRNKMSWLSFTSLHFALLCFTLLDFKLDLHIDSYSLLDIFFSKGVQNAFVNIGETITMSWKNFEENTVNRNCKVIRDIMILSLEPPKNKKFKPIYRLPRPRSGVDSSYISKTPFGDQFKGRGKIVYNSSMSFTLSGVRPSDQNLYCPKAKCRGPIEVVDCSHEAINLIVVAG